MRHMQWTFAVIIACVTFAPQGRGQEPVKPGPGFDVLQKLVGTWDMAIKSGSLESKGTAAIKLDLGGLWVTSELKGEVLGEKFECKIMMTYDTTKKKYTMVRADSLSTTLHFSDGDYDVKTKKLAMTGDVPSEGGATAKLKMVTNLKGDDTFTQTFSLVDSDGKDQEVIAITYTRKK